MFTQAEIKLLTESLNFVTPPENGGQIVDVSYACDADYIFERIYDRSDRSTVFNVYEHPDTESDFCPWNRTPSTGGHVARVEIRKMPNV